MLHNILAAIKDALAEKMKVISRFDAKDLAHWEVAEYTLPSIELYAAALKNPHLLTWRVVQDEFAESGKCVIVYYLGVDLRVYFDVE